MKAEITMKNGISVFSIEGDVDLYSAPDLHRQWLEHSSQAAPKGLILDMEKTNYLDSSGIGVLVRLLTDAKERSIGFRICNVGGMAEKLLRLSRMNMILPMEKSLGEAIARISG